MAAIAGDGAVGWDFVRSSFEVVPLDLAGIRSLRLASLIAFWGSYEQGRPAVLANVLQFLLRLRELGFPHLRPTKFLRFGDSSPGIFAQEPLNSLGLCPA